MSRPLIPAQRRERIQEYLAMHRIAPSSELSALLDVSEATIRRDLEWMESEGILVRTHGGAILNQRLQTEPEYQQRALRNVEEKRQIGALAASLIQDGDIVFVNSGTTTTQLIHNIRSSADITVITNNLSAALEAGEEGFEIILLGGTYQPRSQSVAGRFTIENLGHIYADQAFIGVDGITLKHGYTVPSNAEAEVIRMMMSRTNGPVNALADFSKWGVVSNFEVAQIHQVDRLVTDEQLGAIAREALANKPVEVMIAQAVFAEA
ncbi:MAG TPA: DeoR/GlpR family DNA-binding transcription regulator [Anaerolineales bacterium]|nr:DeoR/GlpR family DNA-binding transcription regulator [Anaerolineales bacterium]